MCVSRRRVLVRRLVPANQVDRKFDDSQRVPDFAWDDFRGESQQADGVTAIPGANVNAGQGSSSVGSTTTDNNGNYSLSTIGAGTYTVVAAATGFVSQVFRRGFL